MQRGTSVRTTSRLRSPSFREAPGFWFSNMMVKRLQLTHVIGGAHLPAAGLRRRRPHDDRRYRHLARVSVLAWRVDGRAPRARAVESPIRWKNAMHFDITQGIAILERTPATLHAMLHDLGTAWIDATEGPETWGAYEIVGHLDRKSTRLN